MKRKLLIVGVCAAAGVWAFLLCGCAGVPKAVSEEEMWARFVGEWEHPEYAGTTYPFAKRRVVRSDLTMVDYYGGTPYEMRVTPARSWTDADGASYFQFYFTDPFYTETYGIGVLRIDREGAVLEHNWIIGVKQEDTKLGEYVLKKLERIDPALKMSDFWGGWSAYRKYFRT